MKLKRAAFAHRRLSSPRADRAFTIVELLIVVVVIAILASLVLVSYGGVKKMAINGVAQTALQDVAKKFETIKINEGLYPDHFPDEINVPSGVGLALTVVPDNQEFCANATAAGYADIRWHVSQTLVLQGGLCSGDVVADSVIGDYNDNTNNEVITAAVDIQGSGGGFKLEANETWSTLTLSWDAVSGATRYELQTKKTSESYWYTREQEDGGQCYGNASYCRESGSRYGDSAHSSHIDATITSLDWTDSSIRPSSSTNGHEYRLRYYDGDGVASAWYTLLFMPTTNSQLTKVSNFKVVPDLDWVKFKLSWDSVIGANNIPSPEIEIQTKEASDSYWYTREREDGGQCYGNASYCRESGSRYGDSAHSSHTPATITSLDWTGSSIKPSSSTNGHEYRIRLRSTLVADMHGNWVAYTVDTPSSVPSVSDFTVTPSSNWSVVVLSWGSYKPTNLLSPEFEIQTKNASDSYWYTRERDDGGQCYGSASYCREEGGSYYNDSPHSSHTPIETTSLDWTSSSSRPVSGAVHQYRIRVRGNGGISGVYSEWSQVDLTRP